MKRFLDLADLERDAVSTSSARGAAGEAPGAARPRGQDARALFFNPSLRTLASFQAGMARLGGTSFVITPGSGTWQLETRLGAVMDGDRAEHVREGIPVLASTATRSASAPSPKAATSPPTSPRPTSTRWPRWSTSR
jgi:N-acetylornithine carbamoyltransferase